MIGKAFVLVDRSGAQGRFEAGADDLIIDAPADVLGPSLATVRPPRVLIRFRVQCPEGIDPAVLFENGVEPGAFLGEEA